MVIAARRGGMQPVLSVAVAVALVACAASPSPSAPGPSISQTAAGQVTEAGITLAAVAEPPVVRAGEVIQVTAELSHDRPEPLVISGSGMGIVFFSVTRVEDGLTSGPALSTGDCARHELPAGEVVTVPFAKSGGWSEDDPNAAFMETYHSHPELTLPPGTWRIDITIRGNVGDMCDGNLLSHELALLVTVTE